MKLHLPKLLFAAVIAVMSATASHALTATSSVGSYASFKTATPAEDETITLPEGWTYDSATGVLKGADNTALWIKLNTDALTSADPNQHVIYVSNDTTTVASWGFNTNSDGTGLTGYWYATTDNNGSWDGGDSSSQIKNIAGSGAMIVKTSISGDGTFMYSDAGTQLYGAGNLKTTNGSIDSVTLNPTYVTEVLYNVELNTQFSNEGGTWTKVFKSTEVTNATSEVLQLNGGDGKSAANNANPIVVGGAGQLHLEAWDQGTVNLDDDIYMGGSTNDRVANFGVVRISNDGAFGANLSGNIYLVEASSIKATGSKSVVISGTITDKDVPGNGETTVDGNYTLTIGGAGFDIQGAVDLGGLNIVQGYASNNTNFPGTVKISSENVTLGSLSVGTNSTLTVTGAMNVGSMVTNEGSIDLSSGSMTFGNVSVENYDALASDDFFNNTGDGKVTSANGYNAINQVVLVKGNVTTNEETTITGTGLDGWSYVQGTGLVGTLSDAVIDTSKFYVNSGTVRISKTDASSDGVIYSDNTADTYIVADGATLDAYFKGLDYGATSEDYALNGKNVVLQTGATLTNTGGYASDSTKQLNNITLTGNATVNSVEGKRYGFLGGGYGATTLDLAGNTLEKTGVGEFVLLHTTVTAGTIKISEGTVLARHTNSNASAASIIMNGANAYLKAESGITLTTGMLSGTGTLNGAGTVEASSVKMDGALTVTGGKLQTSILTAAGGTLTIGNGGLVEASSVKMDGALTVTGGKLKTNTLTAGDGALTIGNGGVLDLTGRYDNLAGDNTRLNDLLSSIAVGVKTEGTGYVLAKGSANAAYATDNINLQSDATLASNLNLVFTDNFALNGRAWGTTTPYKLLVDEGASIKVGQNGTGVLSVVTGATLEMSNSSVTAGSVVLGHSLGVVPTDTGKNQNPHLYHGVIDMSGDDSKLTVDKITFNGSSANAVTVEGGEVEFKNSGNIDTSIIAAADSDDVGTVSFNGTKLVANNSWNLSSSNENVSISLTDAEVEVAEGKKVGLSGSQLVVSGDLTKTGAGMLEVGESGTQSLNQVAVNGGVLKLTNVESVSGVSVSDAATSKVELSGNTSVTKLTLASGLSEGSAAVTTSGALTLGNISLDLTDYAAGNYTLVSATNGISWEKGSWTHNGTLGSDLVANVGFVGGDNKTLTLTIAKAETTVRTVVIEEKDSSFWYTLNDLGASLTLNVEEGSLAGLVEGGLVELELISERMKQDILQKAGFTSDEVAVTLYLSDGTRTIEAGKDAIVGFYNEDHEGYWGKQDGNSRKYELGRIPEPTTTTLSLLALCGLAARRRRRA